MRRHSASEDRAGGTYVSGTQLPACNRWLSSSRLSTVLENAQTDFQHGLGSPQTLR